MTEKIRRDVIRQKEKSLLWDSLGLCTRCGKYPKKKALKACESCLDRARRYHQGQREAIKREVMNAYGGTKCACCGVNILMMLTIDHLDNNGAAHRREIFGYSETRKKFGKGSGGNMYNWLRARGFPEGYQVLCFNCNSAKHINGGVCPHASQTSPNSLRIESPTVSFSDAMYSLRCVV